MVLQIFCQPADVGTGKHGFCKSLLLKGKEYLDIVATTANQKDSAYTPV